MANKSIKRDGHWETTIPGIGITSSISYLSVITNDKPAQNQIRSAIPKYAKITSVTISGQGKYTDYVTDKSRIDIGVYRHYNYKNSSGEERSSYDSYDNDFAEIPKNTLNTFVTFTSPNILNDLTNFQSETPNAGQFYGLGEYGTGSSDANGTTSIRLGATAWDTKDIYFDSFKINYTYTQPILTISAGEGGTVSNSGTYNIDKEETSDSITSITCTANPDNGYRFLQWSDGDKRRTRPFTETDLTSSNTRFVAEFIPIYRIEIDLRNGYFKDISLYNSPEFWIDQYGLWDKEEENNTFIGDVVLQIPERVGYTFKQWVNANTGETFENVTIHVSSTKQNLSYYADWELNSYDLTTEVSPSDAGVLTINYNDVDCGPKASVGHGKVFSLTLNNNNSDKYTHLGIKEYINGNFVKTYSSDNISKLKITNDLSNKAKIHYESNYSLNQWGIDNIIYYIYNESSGDYIKTSEICGNIEVNGILHTDSSVYDYDSIAQIVFIPKFGYNLDHWEIMFEDIKTFNTLVAKDIIFKKTNDIKIYLKKVNMQENSIPDGADSSSVEVKSVTRSIIDKTVENYIENEVPLKRIGKYAFYKCNNLQNFLINQCDIIQSNAFEDCKKLSSIKLPRAAGYTQRKIQPYAFKGCENLMTIIIPGEDLVILEDVNAFNGTPLQIDLLQPGIGYIYVQDKDKYEVGSTEDEQTNWSVFTGHFRDISDYPEICGEEEII